jgi:very-short-patch-repair endonuclease
MIAPALKKLMMCFINFPNNLLKFDFYLPYRNILIEYDGEQHFRPCKINKHFVTSDEVKCIQMRDHIKTKYAKQHGIVLIRIPYTKMSKINDILQQVLTIR